MDHYAWYIEKFFIPVLQDYLEGKLQNELSKLPEYITTLVAPQFPSKIYLERQGFFQIVQKIRDDANAHKDICISQEDFFGKYPEVGQMIHNHLKEFNWIPVLVNNPPTSLEDLWGEIVHFVKDGTKFQVESIRLGDNFDNDILRKKKVLLEKLNPDDIIRSLIEGLEETAFVRTEDNAVMSKSSYLVIPLLTEIAQRIGVTYHELKEFTPEEIITYLQENKKIPRDELEKRLQLSCYLMLNEECMVLTDQDALGVKEAIEKQLKESNDVQDIFHGTPASLGEATGLAKVVESSKDALDIKDGEILVAPATSADFVPAMRKAGAIVTEFGGITSHAAIVAREFNIPCIVGVKNITTFLQDGDKIIVDADKGVVERLY